MKMKLSLVSWFNGGLAGMECRPVYANASPGKLLYQGAAPCNRGYNAYAPTNICAVWGKTNRQILSVTAFSTEVQRRCEM
jgi:hypothetical protein